MNLGGLRVAALVSALAVSACGGDDDDDDDVAPDAAASIDAEPGCTPAFTIFVNPNGGDYTPGMNDASANMSSIIGEAVTLTAHEPPFGHWEATMEDVQRMFAPYDVLVTDQDPGDVPHIEIPVVAEGPEALGLTAGINSIAPFSCSVIDDGIGFVFAGAIGTNNAKGIGDNVGFIGAKFFGLDNVVGCPSISTFLACSGQDREFLDEDLDCGEFDPRMCSCGGTSENHHQLMLTRAGAAQCP